MNATLAVLDGGLGGVVTGAALLLIAIAAWRYMQFRTVTLRDATRAQRREAEQVRRTFEELLAKLEETAEHAARRAQEREAALRDLLRAADARLEALRGTAQPRETSAGPCTPQPPAAAPQAAVAAVTTAAPNAPRSTDDAPLSIPPRRAAAPQVAPPAAVVASQSPRLVEAALVPPDPRFARIVELAEAGQPAARIAEATRTPLGEVELVLNLRRFQSTVAL